MIDKQIFNCPCVICKAREKDEKLNKKLNKKIINKCELCDDLAYLSSKYCQECRIRLKNYSPKQKGWIKRVGIEQGEIMIKSLEGVDISKCHVCGYKGMIQVHHIDQNKLNNKKNNFIPLCLNCHAYIHMKRKTLEQLKKKYQV